ncbi:MAG: hypothetical protein M1815_005879 [Lichina confinis]|nr:MAG: hypothetical protein M1815_005879 [Lichina confinis]
MGLFNRLLAFAVVTYGAVLSRVDHVSSQPHPGLEPLPLIIWHGLGDDYKAEGLQSIGDLAATVHPGTYVYYIHLDEDEAGDRTATFFGNVTDQVNQVCEELGQDPILAFTPVVDALGFSQGGQFLRALIERCNHLRVRSLVTFGSQHNGIAEFQNCGSTDWVCEAANQLLKSSTWSDLVQTHVVPAQYFRDPDRLEEYLENSNFLADVNNERDYKNPRYTANLLALEKFAMYMFRDDKTVIPKESAWFAEVNRTSGNITWLRDRDIYREDWIGLKVLDEQGKLDFLETEGPHMNLEEEVLVETFKKYFGPSVKQNDGEAERNNVVEL